MHDSLDDHLTNRSRSLRPTNGAKGLQRCHLLRDATVDAKTDELNKQILPPDVKIHPYYDRSQLVDLTTDTVGAEERVKLFRLAWDVAGNAFGSRQVLYERFFASDPLTRARAMAAIYPKGEIMERVLEFLGRSDDV